MRNYWLEKPYFRLKRYIFYLTSLSLFFFFLIVLLNFLFPFSLKIPYSKVIINEKNEVLHAYLSADEKWRMYTKEGELSETLKKIIVLKEDQYFFYHFGFNPVSILRAFANNFLSGKTTSGASTITMQLARLIEPKERNYWNKFVEIFRAIQLEFKYSKSEILNLYLTLVPYGGNIEGVKAASYFYFGKSPNHLSLAQEVVLAIVPNKPTSWSLKKPGEKLLLARNKWLRIIATSKVANDIQVEDAIREPLGVRRRTRSIEIPHLARRIQKAHPTVPETKVFINLQVQKNIEQLIKSYMQKIGRLGLYNASAIVVENSSKKIVAYLGSQDFNDENHSGQIDGVSMFRSPGSTLKPLVYGLSFDLGISTPKSIINDVPTNFDGYSPENFDHKFNGAISVEKALSYSLNIPAVKTLVQVNKNKMIELLIKSRFKQIEKNKANLGLSLILGGCSASLEELVGLYSAFANKGCWEELKFYDKDLNRNKLQLLSEESVYMLTQILGQTSRGDLPNGAEHNMHIPKIAWKTGTSYGKKDAWCIGYNQKYTVGIWLGNFNGYGVPELNGAEFATPLLFSIFNLIDYNSKAFQGSPPSQLKTRFVCQETGLMVNDWCNNPLIDYYIVGKSKSQKCEHMKWKWVNQDEQFSFCAHCLPSGGFKKKLYHDYEPELATFYQEQHVPFEKIPPHFPRCSWVKTTERLRITSPLGGKKIIIDKNDKAEIMLQCQVSNGVNQVFWYLNDKYLLTASPQHPVFISPPEGKLKISCSDAEGNNQEIELWVSYE